MVALKRRLLRLFEHDEGDFDRRAASKRLFIYHRARGDQALLSVSWMASLTLTAIIFCYAYTVMLTKEAREETVSHNPAGTEENISDTSGRKVMEFT